MSNHPEDNSQHNSSPLPADPKRRRLASAGIAGTGVLLSVASRSAMGGWGTCTGSELASGNLSRQGEPNPCGCSPGFWWNRNGQHIWTDPKSTSLLLYPPSAVFNTVFGVQLFEASPQVTLAMIGPGKKNKFQLECKSPNLDTVAMQAVAALLNAAYYGNRFPVVGMNSGPDVITAFQSAFSNRCGGLQIFLTKVDIYGKTANLWCNGSPE